MWDPAKAKAIRDFLNWMVEDGQKIAPQLSYAALPKDVAQKVQASIPRIQ